MDNNSNKFPKDTNSSVTSDITNEQQPDNKTSGEKVELDKATYDVLMDVAQKLNLSTTNVDELNQEDLSRVNSVLKQVSALDLSKDNAQSKVMENKIDAPSAVNSQNIGQSSSLLSAVGITSSKEQSTDNLSLSQQNSSNIIILPRLSEYRVGQVEKASNNYAQAQNKFWQSGEMADIKQEIEVLANKNNISFADAVTQMKPNGELSELHGRFNDAFIASPDAQSNKKTMDKALDGWLRQYGRAQEELLSPETAINPQYNGLKQRLETSLDKMQINTAHMPTTNADEYSHHEKMQGSLQNISEKTREITAKVEKMLGGNNEKDNNGPGL